MRTLASKIMKWGIGRKGTPMWKRLIRASQDVQRSQTQVLQDIMSYCAGTKWATHHGLRRIMTPQEFTEAVPKQTYEDLHPWIERHAAGEPDVLFPGKPMFYATTSGTTALPKKIPITRKYHDDCYNGLSNLWLHSMFTENPGFMNGYDISMVGKAIEGYTQDGTSYGSFSGHMNAYMPEFIKKFRVVPFAVHDIDDYDAKYYTLLRVALQHPIAWIVAANPSNLLELARVAENRMSQFIVDIEQGTLRQDLNIDPAIRQAVESRLTPDKQRARHLAALQAAHPTLRPKHYWPTLQVINTWKCGGAAQYLARTEGYFPDQTVVREFGYLATEARAGIIVHNDQLASILAAHLLYFEFIHVDELDNAHPTWLGAHQLEVGEAYGIYITTPSGLYRYEMNDIVQVDGFYNTFPMVRFLHKGAGITSLTGEKLTESQFLQAVTTCTAQMGNRAQFAIGFADFSSDGYHAFIEFEKPPTREFVTRASNSLDDLLRNINPEYDAKRGSNRLRPIEIAPLGPDAFTQYKNSMLQQGAREGQFKLNHLQQNDAMLACFRKQTANR